MLRSQESGFRIEKTQANQDMILNWVQE